MVTSSTRLPRLARPSIAVAAKPRASYRSTTAEESAGAAADARAAAGSAHDLRDAVSRARRAMADVLALSVDVSVSGGELGALIELVGTLDVGHAAAVELTDQIETQGISERRAALPLEGLLAMRSRMTFGDRRALLTIAETLRGLPNLRQAFLAGAVGWAQVRAIVIEVRPLRADARLQLDARFADHEALGRMDADQLIDVVRDDAGRLRQDLATDRAVRAIESRFLYLQPALDGALTGYFELDPEAGTTFLEGLESVMPAPSAGPNDVTRHAIGEGDADDVGGSTGGHDRRADADVTDGDETSELDGSGPDGQPAWVDPVQRRSRARQRADGLVRLAEGALAGGETGDGRRRRARVRMHVVADIATLTGDDASARAARLLWRTVGTPPALTAEGARRLASDADLQFLLTDGGEVLGVSAPTPSIPAKVRAAVHVRDRGCRFPGCSVPPQWTDLHHVVAREDGGPTTVDNLVGLCRRHHVAVTEGRWKLTMTPGGVVTVRRGRQIATSDPPALRERPPPAASTTTAGAAPIRISDPPPVL